MPPAGCERVVTLIGQLTSTGRLCARPLSIIEHLGSSVAWPWLASPQSPAAWSATH